MKDATYRLWPVISGRKEDPVETAGALRAEDFLAEQPLEAASYYLRLNNKQGITIASLHCSPIISSTCPAEPRRSCIRPTRTNDRYFKTEESFPFATLGISPSSVADLCTNGT